MGETTRPTASTTAAINISSVSAMAPTRKVPRRRPRGTANTVGLMVHVDPHVKGLCDRMAAAADVNQWEVVTAALLQLAATVNDDGIPAALTSPAQPSLISAEPQEVTAA